MNAHQWSYVVAIIILFIHPESRIIVGLLILCMWIILGLGCQFGHININSVTNNVLVLN